MVIQNNTVIKQKEKEHKALYLFEAIFAIKLAKSVDVSFFLSGTISTAVICGIAFPLK